MTFAVKLIRVVWGRVFNGRPGTVSEKHCCLLLFVIKLQFAFLAWLNAHSLGFPGDASGKKKKKKSICQCRTREMGSLPGSGRSLGEENGNPLQYSCLENPVAWGAWQATVCGVTKSWTQLSTWTHTHTELSVNLDCSSQWSRTAMLKYLCLQTG